MFRNLMIQISAVNYTNILMNSHRHPGEPGEHTVKVLQLDYQCVHLAKRLYLPRGKSLFLKFTHRCHMN